MNTEEFADLLVAVNPERDSSLRFLLLIPFNGGTVMASAGRWPGSRSLYCLPLSPRRWPHTPELIERIPVLSCARRGATIDLVLDRGRNSRSQFVYTECGGRRMVFWQSARSRTQYRPRAAPPPPGSADNSRFEIVADTREKDGYTFAYQPVSLVRHALACGDYAVTVDGRIIAAVERKSLSDLAASVTDHSLDYAMAHLAALPHAAVVVDDHYRLLFDLEHIRDTSLADRIALLQVRYPAVPIVFPGSRGLAEEWTFRFLAAARRWTLDERAAAQRFPENRPEIRTRTPTAHSPEEHAIRLWARSVGLPLEEHETIRPTLRTAWHRTRPWGRGTFDGKADCGQA